MKNSRIIHSTLCNFDNKLYYGIQNYIHLEIDWELHKKINEILNIDLEPLQDLLDDLIDD